MRIEEYDDGYDSKESFERAGCDTEESLEEPTPNHLPPDPEGMNDNRAEWAAVAVRAFMDATGTDAEDAVADLLADLHHYCDRNGFDFARELSRADWHYAEETGQPEPPPAAARDDDDLALWFTPDAIRGHFDGDDDETAEWVANASDEELREIGEACLTADSLYGLFHMLLLNAVDNAREGA